MALKLLPEDLSDVPVHLADKYEAQAGRYWDLFYRRNNTKFFKDRHYLHKEFPDLAAGAATLLEVGCGVGNTVFPLLELNPALRIFCCDFAPSAIELVRQNPLYESSGGAVHAFVADITADLLAAPTSEGGCGVPPEGCDLATMVFVLSAIHPQRMAAAVHNVARCLRPGTGRLLFRDYAEGDLAMERLAGGDVPKRLGPNFYVRGDGTRCYYFSQPEVLALFASAGFHCDSLLLHERTVVNHKRDIAMDRRWLQAIFTLREPRPPPMLLEALLRQPLQQQHHHHHHELQPWQLAAQSPAAPYPPGNHHNQHHGEASGMMNVDEQQAPVVPSGMMDVDEQQAPVVPSGPAVASMTGGIGGAVDNAGLGLGPGPGPGFSGRSWLTGAAGRLASHLAAGPGHPSGRAQLPDSLDAADDVCAELSPSHQQHSQSNHHNSPRCQIPPRASPSGQQHQQHQRVHQHQHHSRLGAGANGREPESAGSVVVQDGGGAMQLDPDSDGDGDGYTAHGDGNGDDDGPLRSRRRRASTTDDVVEGMDGGEEGCGGGGDDEDDGSARGGRSLESQLEAEFFATIGRDSAEIVAEEVAAAGAALARVRLAEVAEVAAASLSAAAAAAVAAAGTLPSAGSRACGGGGGSSAAAAVSVMAVGSDQHQLQQRVSEDHVLAPTYQQQLLQPPPLQEMEVPVADGVSFRCLCPVSLPAGTPIVQPATLALANIFQASPRLMAGKCALQLGPARHPPLYGCTAAPITAAPPAVPVTAAAAAAVLPAMAAVRCSARRVVVAEAAREGLAAAAADLRRNAHKLVIERLRLATLDWTGGAGLSASAALGSSSSAGYTYVSGIVRQIRDVLQIQPTGYDIVYTADPLAAVTATASGGTAGEIAIAAARGLFEVAEQLLTSRAQGTAAGGGSPTPRLLLLCFPGPWAAAHGLGFAALAAVCGWELLVPEQLAELYGVNAAAGAVAGCAVMGFRRRMPLQ